MSLGGRGDRSLPPTGCCSRARCPTTDRSILSVTTRRGISTPTSWVTSLSTLRRPVLNGPTTTSLRVCQSSNSSCRSAICSPTAIPPRRYVYRFVMTSRRLPEAPSVPSLAVWSRSTRVPARSLRCGPTPVSTRTCLPTPTGLRPMLPSPSCEPTPTIRCLQRPIARSSSRVLPSSW